MVSGHDLKVFIQYKTAAEARAAFLTYLDNYYNTRDKIIPAHET